jgi:hypothetical protein
MCLEGKVKTKEIVSLYIVELTTNYRCEAPSFSRAIVESCSDDWQLQHWPD